MSNREKIVARPSEFQVGDYVQQLDTGEILEIVSRSGTRGGSYKVRAVRVDQQQYEPTRDYVVERRLPEQARMSEEKAELAVQALEAIETFIKDRELSKEDRAKSIVEVIDEWNKI